MDTNSIKKYTICFHEYSADNGADFFR